jgi:hypothetical protein|tara:strand:- start:824 stop:1063 length:240 start_codon:yes stop_codon:yes gene_type:complete
MQNSRFYLPDEIASKIIFDSIILLKNEKWRDIHDELKIKLITPANKHGCIFLHYTNILELVNTNYINKNIERLPRLERV